MGRIRWECLIPTVAILVAVFIGIGCTAEAPNKPDFKIGDSVALVSDSDSVIGHVVRVYDYFGEWTVSVRMLENKDLMSFRAEELVHVRRSNR